MSNELQSARAMVVIELWWRFRIIGAGASGDQVGYYCVRTERHRGLRQVRQTRSEDHVLGRELRLYVSCLSAVFVFVNLSFAYLPLGQVRSGLLLGRSLGP
jgi:hypothetical protein